MHANFFGSAPTSPPPSLSPHCPCAAARTARASARAMRRAGSDAAASAAGGSLERAAPRVRVACACGSAARPREGAVAGGCRPPSRAHFGGTSSEKRLGFAGVSSALLHYFRKQFLAQHYTFLQESFWKFLSFWPARSANARLHSCLPLLTMAEARATHLGEQRLRLAGDVLWASHQSRATKVIESCNWFGATGTRRGDRPGTRRGDRRIVRSYLISAEISGNAKL